MFLSDVSIKRPVFATMMMVALVVLGIVSFRRLAVDEYPDVTYPVVVVQTTYRGASPQVVEREISRPIEESLNTVQGIKEISSTSREGSSMVRAEFELGVDVLSAQQDVQAKVAALRRTLPEEMDEPVVRHFDPNERSIMSVALQSDQRSIRELTDLAEEVAKIRVEAVPGVGEVDVVGGMARQINVQLNPDALRAYGLSPAQVTAALQRENQEVPAGRVQRGETQRLVRVTGRIVDPRDFAEIVVATRDGAPVRIGDVATVVDGTEDENSGAYMGSARAVSLEVLKISGANTVEVVDGVRSAVAELERQLPSDIRVNVVQDDSKRIRDSLSDVELTIMLGAILTIAIIYLFLNSWRSTVITGLTLPVSVISSFFIMWVFDFTLNTMTLMGLSLAIGLLIDDAIVVRENIVRHLELGKDHFRAAKDGTDEIGLAVVSTTLAVIAVFVPVAFMGGMIGRIFFQFGVTVAFAVLVSLFVSFTLDPMLSSIWTDPDVEAHGANAGKKGPIRRTVAAFNDSFERIADHYPRGLAWALEHRAAVLGVALLSVVASFAILPKLGFTWMPETNGDDFTVSYRTAPGSRLPYTVARGQEIDAILKQDPAVDLTYLSVGGGFRGSATNGRIQVNLKPGHERTLDEIQTDLRKKFGQVPGARVSIQGQRSIFGGFRQPITVNVQGPEVNRLKLAAQQVLETMHEVPGVAEPTSSDEGEVPQLDVVVDRQQAWAAGVGVGSIASTLQPLFQGQRATQWEDPLGYSHDVMVVYPDSLRENAENVADIPVASTTGATPDGRPEMVPLAQVAEVRAGTGPQQIERRALQRMISISAGVLPGYGVGDVAAAVEAAIDSVGLPPGYSVAFTGDVQNLQETKGYVLEAIILAVIFIYLILASLFGSFLQPLSILMSLPMSFIGVALALLLTGGNLNVMSMIGIIMLMGLVTKNGILLVDFANQRRAQGEPRVQALLESGRVRLRPIIMTTVAMIFGMLPLAFAIGAGAEERAPMARAVIGGLITSTLLTLFVVPVVYTLLDDLSHVREWVRNLLRRRGAQESPAHGPTPAPSPTAVAGD
jgi:HAE1 family hydrophobic/amphiphilic exporter-1